MRIASRRIAATLAAIGSGRSAKIEIVFKSLSLALSEISIGGDRDTQSEGNVGCRVFLVAIPSSLETNSGFLAAYQHGKEKV